jgi:hypothetical protein
MDLIEELVDGFNRGVDRLADRVFSSKVPERKSLEEEVNDSIGIFKFQQNSQSAHVSKEYTAKEFIDTLPDKWKADGLQLLGKFEATVNDRILASDMLNSARTNQFTAHIAPAEEGFAAAITKEENAKEELKKFITLAAQKNPPKS